MLPARDLHCRPAAESRRTAGVHQWTRRLLVVSEVAFALVLLVNAGLLWRSLELCLQSLRDSMPPTCSPCRCRNRVTDSTTTPPAPVLRAGAGRGAPRPRRQLPRRSPACCRSAAMRTTAWSSSREPATREVYSIRGDAGILRNHGNPAAPRPAARRRETAECAACGTDQRISGEAQVPQPDPIGQRVRVGPDIGHATGQPLLA